MGGWSNPFFGCFNNCTLCVLSTFAGCYVAGKNAEAVGDDCVTVGVLYALIRPVGVFLTAKTREKIRQQKGIEVSFTH